ncbi:MAG: DUF1573 domain-containing protein [Deltaproteobacteria bacterium]|nr:DUF1573 domain-containing protein [Deltaproteobacteria bacterium]
MQFKSTVSANVFVVLLACMLAAFAPGAVQALTDAQRIDKKPGEAPAIVFETREHDFGTAQPNAPLTHSFVFKNQGKAALLIKNIKSG